MLGTLSGSIEGPTPQTNNLQKKNLRYSRLLAQAHFGPLSARLSAKSTKCHEVKIIKNFQFNLATLRIYTSFSEEGLYLSLQDPSSGTSRDWAKGVLGGEYVYTIELRDDGEHGFELPPDQIIPCIEETWAGFKAFLLFI